MWVKRHPTHEGKTNPRWDYYEKEVDPEANIGFFPFERFQNIFNKDTSPEEMKELKRGIKEWWGGATIVSSVFRDLDPFFPKLKIRIGEQRGSPRGSYNYDDKTGQEFGYHVNTSKYSRYSRKPEKRILEALDFGLHEIRHRAQHLDQKLEKLTIKDVKEKGLFDKEFESRIKSMEKERTLRDNPKEADAALFATVSQFLYRNGLNPEEIKNLVKMGREEIISFLEKRKEVKEK